VEKDKSVQQKFPFALHFCCRGFNPTKGQTFEQLWLGPLHVKEGRLARWQLVINSPTRPK
jgi:hypothetical protein